MTRTKSTEAPAIAPAVELRQDVVDAANVMAIAQAGYGEERDLLNQLLGQAQMADAVAKLTATVAVTKMAYVKENKLYQALSGMKDRDGRGLSGTWEEFCKLLGTSAPKVNEDISNLQSFGEEALESMSRMGIGYRELRQFRKLPEDQKTALIEVAKAGDKESFVELAEEIIAKHAKEKEALTQRVDDAKADLEARARVLEDKNSKIDQLTEDVAKLEKRISAMPPIEIGEQIRAEAISIASKAEVSILAVRHALTALSEHTEQHGISHEDVMAGLLGQMELAIRRLRGEFGLKERPDGQEIPDWLREDEPQLSVDDGQLNLLRTEG